MTHFHKATSHRAVLVNSPVGSTAFLAVPSGFPHQGPQSRNRGGFASSLPTRTLISCSYGAARAGTSTGSMQNRPCGGHPGLPLGHGGGRQGARSCPMKGPFEQGFCSRRSVRQRAPRSAPSRIRSELNVGFVSNYQGTANKVTPGRPHSDPSTQAPARTGAIATTSQAGVCPAETKAHAHAKPRTRTITVALLVTSKHGKQPKSSSRGEQTSHRIKHGIAADGQQEGVHGGSQQ